MQVVLGSRRTLPTVEGAFCTGNVLPLLCMMPLFPHAIGELCSSPPSSSSCKQSSLKRQRMGRGIERRPVCGRSSYKKWNAGRRSAGKCAHISKTSTSCQVCIRLSKWESFFLFSLFLLKSHKFFCTIFNSGDWPLFCSFRSSACAT